MLYSYFDNKNRASKCKHLKPMCLKLCILLIYQCGLAPEKLVLKNKKNTVKGNVSHFLMYQKVFEKVTYYNT